MRKLISIFLMLMCTVTICAQRKFDPEKFRAELHQYMIQEARMTNEEVEKFFPLFDEMKAKQRSIHQQLSVYKKQKPSTEAACLSAIINKDNQEIKMKQIEKLYHQKLLKVIPALRLYDILKAETNFHKKYFRNAVK